MTSLDIKKEQLKALELAIQSIGGDLKTLGIDSSYDCPKMHQARISLKSAWWKLKEEIRAA